MERPWRRAEQALLLVGLVALATGFGYWMHSFVQYESANVRYKQRMDDLRVGHEASLSRHNELQVLLGQRDHRIIALEQDIQVNRATIRELQHELRSQAEEAYQLQRELHFYEGLMESQGSSLQVQIQGLFLRYLQTSGQYRYQLVLANWDQGKKIHEVDVRISIIGTLNGEAQSLPIGELYVGEKPMLRAKFRNFSDIEGNFMLPEGFQPVSIAIGLQPLGKDAKLVERIFDWNGVMKS
ncbi:MAG: DUF6776 family protein [Candidatus Eutrophobiaceae bacterium]